jgi:hypothetical protein
MSKYTEGCPKYTYLIKPASDGHKKILAYVNVCPIIAPLSLSMAEGVVIALFYYPKNTL